MTYNVFGGTLNLVLSIYLSGFDFDLCIVTGI